MFSPPLFNIIDTKHDAETGSYRLEETSRNKLSLHFSSVVLGTKSPRKFYFVDTLHA